MSQDRVAIIRALVQRWNAGERGFEVTEAVVRSEIRGTLQ